MAPGPLGITVALALAGVSVLPAVGPAEPHGNPRPAAAPGNQSLAHATTLDGTSTVVWTDWRGNGADLWTTRLEPDGGLPGRAGAYVAPGPVAGSGIASGDGSIWRVWMVGAAPPYTVYGQLAQADGTPAGPALQLGPPVRATAPAAAWSGQEFVTVWADLAAPQLVGARTTLDGGVQTVSMSTPTAADSASVACGPGPACLVVFISPSPPLPLPRTMDIRGRFFDPATLGWVSGVLTISSTPNHELDPVVAYEPTRDAYVVTWRESAGSADVIMAAVQLDAGMVGPVPLAQTGDEELDPAVSCRLDGADLCAIALRNDTHKEIHLYRLRGDLSLIDATPQVWVAAKDYVANPTVSLSPGGGALAWHGTNPDKLNGDEVYGLPLDPAGLALGSPAVLSQAANGQEFPEVASAGTRSWMLWRDDGRQPGPGNYQVSMNDGTSWKVDDADILSNLGSWTRGTIAAYGPSEALAVWADQGSTSLLGYAVIDVLGGVQATGVALNGVTGCLELGAVAFDNAVVVAARCANNTLWATAYQDGAWLPGVPISALGTAITGPAVGTDGTRGRLVWSDDRSGSPRLYGTRLDPDGGSLDGEGVELAAASGNQARPSIAYAGGTWLLAWEESEADGGSHIRGNRYGADWQPLDAEPLVLRQPVSKAGAPRLLAVNGGFLMAWEEDTNRGDVRAALVDTQGAVGEPFDVSSGPEWEGQVSLAPGRSETEVLAAYSALDPAAGVASRRAYTRWIDLTGGQQVPGDDAGIPPNDPFRIGCDCSSTGGGAFWAALVLAVAAAARVRSRRSAPRS